MGKFLAEEFQFRIFARHGKDFTEFHRVEGSQIDCRDVGYAALEGYGISDNARMMMMMIKMYDLVSACSNNYARQTGC